MSGACITLFTFMPGLQAGVCFSPIWRVSASSVYVSGLYEGPNEHQGLVACERQECGVQNRHRKG